MRLTECAESEVGADGESALCAVLPNESERDPFSVVSPPCLPPLLLLVFSESRNTNNTREKRSGKQTYNCFSAEVDEKYTGAEGDEECSIRRPKILHTRISDTELSRMNVSSNKKYNLILLEGEKCISATTEG